MQVIRISVENPGIVLAESNPSLAVLTSLANRPNKFGHHRSPSPAPTVVRVQFTEKLTDENAVRRSWQPPKTI